MYLLHLLSHVSVTSILTITDRVESPHNKVNGEVHVLAAIHWKNKNEFG